MSHMHVLQKVSVAMTSSIGSGLPSPLAERIAAGAWLRTAHRGAPTLAPGNSRRAIEAAIALDIDMVEVDVHRTADGHLVLWHDPDLSNGAGDIHIASATLAEVQAVDIGAGEHIVTLRDGLHIVRGRAMLFIDLKADDLAEPIVAVVEQQGNPPLMVCGRYWQTLRDIKRLRPAIGTSLTLPLQWQEMYGADTIEQTNTDAVTVDARAVTPELIARCHTRNIAVLAWTIDDLPQMRSLLAAGVDGITSNRPDRFAAV